MPTIIPPHLEPHLGHTLTAEMREVAPVNGYEAFEPTGELNCSCGARLREAGE